MRIEPPDSPTFDAKTTRAATGKAPEQWFADLDATGQKGRRELVTRLYTACKLPEWWATTIAVEYERARGIVEKDGKPKGYSICSTKTVAAPLADVFAAFGDQDKLDRWLGPKTQVRFADGGGLQNGDGDRATFTRIRAGKDLRLRWEHASRAPGSQVEVLFADKGKGKTGITLNHTRIQERRHADELRAGWAEVLEKLKMLLEQ